MNTKVSTFNYDLCLETSFECIVNSVDAKVFRLVKIFHTRKFSTLNMSNLRILIVFKN